MAKFDAGSLERLEYDFTAYGGGAGFIQEPSTRKVNEFFKNMRQTMKLVRSLQSSVDGADSDKIEEMSPEELAEQMGKVEEATSGAEELQNNTMINLALLCGAEWEHRDSDGNIVKPTDEGWGSATGTLVGGSPTLGEFEGLPYRILQSFTNWLMEEIKPSKNSTGPVGKR